MQSQQIVKTATKSFSIPNDRRPDEGLFRIDDGQVKLKDRLVEQLFGIRANTIRNFCNEPSLFIVIGRQEQWVASAVNENGSLLWKKEVGDQFFENDVESVCVSRNGSVPLVAIVGSDRSLKVLDKTGRELISANLSKLANGFCVVKKGAKIKVIVSDASGLTCWSIDEGFKEAGPKRSTTHR